MSLGSNLFIIANAGTRLASEIYGSGARFVFELLQNADDNLFSKAGRNGSEPFITFKIYKSHIVIDCNEDGFTEQNLNAICAVGQSTKSAEYGYIGAKGIGFKSVFIVAEKVCIQSGSFSFKFEHKKNEPGIGMVRPLWFDAQEQLVRPLTRTTLHLHSGNEDTAELKQMIVNELADLKDSCLLFLKKLKRITVEHYDDEGRVTKSTEYSKTKIDEYRVGLNRITIANGERAISRQIYHITTRKASGIEWSAGRSKPPSNTAAAAAASSADVVLAFPLRDEYTPMCTVKQQLFAFLPLRTHDYKVSAGWSSEPSCPLPTRLQPISLSFIPTLIQLRAGKTLSLHQREIPVSENGLPPRLLLLYWSFVGTKSCATSGPRSCQTTTKTTGIVSGLV